MRLVLGRSALALWFLLMVDGSFTQLQIALSGGRLVAPPGTLKAALLLVLLSCAFLAFREGRAEVPKRSAILWFSFVSFLSVHALYFSGAYDRGLGNALASYNYYYFYLIILPLLFLARGMVSARKAAFWVGALFLPLAGLGIAQHVLNDPIVATVSTDAGFWVNSFDFYGDLRVFSLFTSPASFGNYIALAGALGIVLLCGPGKSTKVAGLTLAILAGVAGFLTFTRAAYMGITMAMVAAYLLARAKKSSQRRWLLLLPIAYGLVGIFVAFSLPSLLAEHSASTNLLTDDSLQMRYDVWSIHASLWLQGDLLTLLLGTGLIQAEGLLLEETAPIDNLFLAIGVSIGALGLLLCLALMWQLWRLVLGYSEQLGGPLPTAIAATFSTWIAIGMFNIGVTTSLLLVMLLLMCSEKPKSQQDAQLEGSTLEPLVLEVKR